MSRAFVRRRRYLLFLAFAVCFGAPALSGADAGRQEARARLQRFQSYKAKVLEGPMGGLLDVLVQHHHGSWRHSVRVARLSRQIAASMGLKEKDQHKAWLAGLAHDIGKIDIPRELLDNDDELTPEELQIILQHPENGARHLVRVGAPGAAVTGALNHHERLDGRGYPRQLKGREIPRLARIVTVADTYEAATEKRRYQKALTPTEARQLLIDGKGTKFEAVVVDAFLSLVRPPASP